MPNWSDFGNLSHIGTAMVADGSSNNVMILQLLFYSIIIVTGLVGNILICLAIRSRKKRKTSEYFILNLAITDLSTLIVSIPLDIIERLAGYWPYGSFLCKLVYPLQTILMAVSVSTLLAMSLERHRAIMHPLKPRMKGRKLIIVIFAIWLGSIVLISPYISVLGFDGFSCVENWPGTPYVKAYTMSVFIVLYVCPLFGITVAYMRIGRTLYRDIENMKVIMADAEGGLTEGEMLNTGAHRNVRIVKIFVTAVIVFAVCMLPNHVMWLWYDYGVGYTSKHFADLLVFSNILVYANSCINPFIFCTLLTSCGSCCKDIMRGSQDDRDESRGHERMFTSSSKRRPYSGTLRRPSQSFCSATQLTGKGISTRTTMTECQMLDGDIDGESNL